MPIELPPDHRRSISTTAQIVEKTLNEMEELLCSEKDNIALVVSQNYTDEEKAELLLNIAELRKCNQELFREFNLKQTKQSESQILRAQIAYLWTILMDSKSKKLRGYGELPSSIAMNLDTRINKLLTVLNEISKKV